MPDAWRGRYIAADLLGHAVRAHEVYRRGSTFQARQIGDVLRANDTWFAPTDQTLGPDGAVFIADWHDRRTAHPDPDADWDRTNGRIFAITARGAGPTPTQAQNLGTRTNRELLALLKHPNVWYRRKARRLLAERQAADVSTDLHKTVMANRGSAALEALWALHGCRGLDEASAETFLRHSDADVRAWCVRLIGDDSHISSRLMDRLAELATREPDVRVRSQLASTARRLTPSRGLDVAQNLLLRNLDADDPHIPLLLWWAVEQHAVTDLEDTLARFTSPTAWHCTMISSTILGRLVRRLAAERTTRGDTACARVLASAPSPEAQRLLLIAA